MELTLSLTAALLEAHGFAAAQPHEALGWVDTGAGTARMDEARDGIMITGTLASIAQWLENEAGASAAVALLQAGAFHYE